MEMAVLGSLEKYEYKCLPLRREPSEKRQIPARASVGGYCICKMIDQTRHVPILLREVLRILNCRPGRIYIDATLGGGGHSRAMLDASSPDGLVIGIDRDRIALKIARESLTDYLKRVKFIQGNFRKLKEVCKEMNITEADGILMDLGMSSDQLEQAHRGFSFRFPEDPLDMRMDETASLTAADVLNECSEEMLRNILLRYGEERWAAAIAREVVSTRRRAPFRKVGDLVSAIRRAIPSKARHSRRHMATKTFQALRIYVNGELEALRQGLQAGLSLLVPGGRLVVISYHSLEDRIVKQTFNLAAKAPRDFAGPSFTILTRRPIRPSRQEITRNPRARSAKLRAIERLHP